MEQHHRRHTAQSSGRGNGALWLKTTDSDSWCRGFHIRGCHPEPSRGPAMRGPLKRRLQASLRALPCERPSPPGVPSGDPARWTLHGEHPHLPGPESRTGRHTGCFPPALAAFRKPGAKRRGPAVNGGGLADNRTGRWAEALRPRSPDTPAQLSVHRIYCTTKLRGPSVVFKRVISQRGSSRSASGSRAGVNTRCLIRGEAAPGALCLPFSLSPLLAPPHLLPRTQDAPPREP